MNRSKIGVRERVSSRNGGLARTGFVEGSEQPIRSNVANGFGIYQRGDKAQWLGWAHVNHLQAADVEFQRRLARVIGIDDEFRPGAHKVPYRDTHFPGTPAQVFHLLPIFHGRDIHREAIDEDRVHIHPSPEKIAQSSLKPEFSNLQQRLNSVLPGIGVGSAVNFQALTADVDSVGDPHVKFGEFHAALEAGRESFDDPGAEDGLRAQDGDSDADGDGSKYYRHDANDPPPPTRTVGARLARLRRSRKHRRRWIEFGQALMSSLDG